MCKAALLLSKRKYLGLPSTTDTAFRYTDTHQNAKTVRSPSRAHPARMIAVRFGEELAGGEVGLREPSARISSLSSRAGGLLQGPGAPSILKRSRENTSGLDVFHVLQWLRRPPPSCTIRSAWLPLPFRPQISGSCERSTRISCALGPRPRSTV